MGFNDRRKMAAFEVALTPLLKETEHYFRENFEYLRDRELPLLPFAIFTNPEEWFERNISPNPPELSAEEYDQMATTSLLLEKNEEHKEAFFSESTSKLDSPETAYDHFWSTGKNGAHEAYIKEGLKWLFEELEEVYALRIKAKNPLSKYLRVKQQESGKSEAEFWNEDEDYLAVSEFNANLEGFVRDKIYELLTENDRKIYHLCSREEWQDIVPNEARLPESPINKLFDSWLESISEIIENYNNALKAQYKNNNREKNR